MSPPLSSSLGSFSFCLHAHAVYLFTLRIYLLTIPMPSLFPQFLNYRESIRQILFCRSRA